jgi:hypothetical protein
MIDSLSRRRCLRTLTTLMVGGVASPALVQAQTLVGAVSASSLRDNAWQLAQALQIAAPAVSPRVLLLATEALQRARVNAQLPGGDPEVLAVLDFSLASTEKRLWVFDLKKRALLFEEWAAHGRNTGDNFAQHFSNRHESHMSSLGAYQAGKVYMGRNGYSLRLHGLEPGFNDAAFDRAIVIHGAPYVSADIVRKQGRLGRSFGCPAVRMPIARPLIDALAEQAFLFNYYPQREWLERSALIGSNAA